MILGGDFNTKLRSLGYRYDDDRGRITLDFIATYNLHLVNEPDSNTYDQLTATNIQKLGNPDLTLISPSILTLLV